MSFAFGKRSNASWDAQRVQSLSRSGATIENFPDLGGGLQNKIYLWPSDGSTISTYDPTEAGVIAACAAQVSGDTVWLPSIPIAMTAPLTIVAGGALRGISHNAILNFSGFAGACIVLSADSIIDGFTLNHSDGKWFNASADGSKALRIHGTAQRATIGLTVVPTVTEIWAGEANGIYWKAIAGNWSKVASNPDANGILWTGMTRDGATLYAATGASSDITKIYKCNNPKAGSPTWTNIAQIGDSAAGSTISTYFTYTMGPCVLNGLTLYTLCHLAVANEAWAYGSYNGSAWTWSRTTDYNTFSPAGVGKNVYSFDSGGPKFRDGSNVQIDTLANGQEAGYEFYTAPNGNRYATHRASSTLYLRLIGSTDIETLGSSGFAEETTNSKITGAETGDQVYVVSAASGADGHLWLSDDGSTFSDVATWTEGWVKDETYSGSGTLIWLPRSVSDAATMCRRYTRAGSVDADLTANFWSVAPAGNKTFKGLSLVYA